MNEIRTCLLTGRLNLGIFPKMGMGMGSGKAGLRHRRAFSMVELVVCIGIIMILIGIMLPTLGRTRDQAIRTRNLASMRGAMSALTRYTTDNDDRYPIGWSDPVNAAKLWYLPLQVGGHIGSWRDLGILNVDEDRALIALSHTAILPGTVFDPTAGIDAYQAPLASQRASAVQFAAEKGLLWQYLAEFTRGEQLEWCCLREAPIAPVAFADGSARLLHYQQFAVNPEPVLALHVGIPVVATWHGLGGRDSIK